MFLGHVGFGTAGTKKNCNSARNFGNLIETYQSKFPINIINVCMFIIAAPITKLFSRDIVPLPLAGMSSWPSPPPGAG